MDIKDIPLAVNNKMAFDALDFLEAVNSLDRVRQSTATGCTVYETHGRIFIASTLPSGICNQKPMDSVEQTFGIPVSPLVIYGLPVGIAYRQKSPLATAPQKVEYRLENTEGIMLPPAFHQIRKGSDQNTPFPAVNFGDVYERIIIFLYQMTA